MPHGLIGVDYFILGVIGLSMLISLRRGFVREVLSLAAWIAASFMAFSFMDTGAAYLVDYISVPSVRIILAFSGLFLITLFLGGLVNLAMGHMIERTGLSSTDRMVGIIFGVLRGVTIISILVLLAGLTSLPEDPWWDQSLLLSHFQPLALWLRDFLPAELAKHFTFT